jgi:predicted O-methyltransferase YrrM
MKRTSSDRDDLFARLTAALEGVEGWFQLPEAWALHEAVRAISKDPPRVVEIGSYKGRSTISMGLSLLARGGSGTILAIDPHKMEPGQYEAFRANIGRAGVAELVHPLVSMSHEARETVEDATIDLLFVDGSHEYESVVQDVRDWESALAPGAVVAFNDPYWRGVSRALYDSIAYKSSPFRRPRWVVNTLFVDYLPGEPWGPAAEIMMRRLRAYLRLGRGWLDIHQKIVNSPRVPTWIKQGQLRVAQALFSAILPRGDAHDLRNLKRSRAQKPSSKTQDQVDMRPSSPKE